MSSSPGTGLAKFNSAEAARNAYFSGSNGDDGSGNGNGQDGRNGNDRGRDGRNGRNGENGEDDGSGSEWTEWFRVDQVAGWFIYGREHTQDPTVQYHITATSQDGGQVYLNKSGEVVDKMVIMDSMDQVNAALEAYVQNEEDGEVDDGDQPTGEDPGPGSGGPGGPRRGGAGGPAGGGGLPVVNSLPIVGNLGTIGQAIVVILIAFAVYYYYRTDGDLSELPVVGGGSA